MPEEPFKIDWGDVLGALQIVRILENQPHFFEGRHPKLHETSPEGEILRGVPMPDIVATMTLRNRFYSAAQGLLLHVLLHRDEYEIKKSQEWDPQKSETVSMLRLTQDSVSKIRAAILNIVPYLCNGDENYQALLQKHTEAAFTSEDIKDKSAERAESLMLERQLEMAAKEYNFLLG